MRIKHKRIYTNLLNMQHIMLNKPNKFKNFTIIAYTKLVNKNIVNMNTSGGEISILSKKIRISSIVLCI